MKYISYIISYAFLWLLSILPGWLLYRISDLLYLFICHIIRYRRKVVIRNVENSFPKMSPKEQARLRRKFYRNLTDVIVENAVIQFWPKHRLKKMFSFTSTDLVEKYFDQGRHIILITGHFNNWEWASPLSYCFRHLVLAVYKPLRNPYFDRAYIRARTRFGAVAVPMGSIGRALFDYREKKMPTLTGMVADQRPLRKQVQYWTEFLNQQTAVFTGSEKLAKKFDAVVVFMSVRRTQRGRYVADIELITDDPASTSPNEITEKHTRKLESLILEEPSGWLWSHNRWKISYEQWASEKGL